MTAGAYISGAGHLALILWVLLGGILFRADEPMEPQTAEVRLLSESEFLSLTAGRPEPDAVQEVAAPSAPGTEETPEVAAAADAPPAHAPRPEIAAPADPDATPQAPDLSTPETEVSDAAPEAPVAPQADQMVALLPPALSPGAPREAPRVAPIPVPEAPPQAETAPEFVAPTAPDEAPVTEPVEDSPPTAPEETTSEIVTEARPDEPEGAKVAALAPRLRPRDEPTPRQSAEAPTSAPAASPGRGSATAAAPAADPDLPVGPPLSYGEVDRLVAALSNCWSIGTLSTAAASSTVVVGVSMNPDGTPIASSIHMVDGRGPDDRSVNTAYEYAKRAVRRCGVRGFPLPKEKYAHWAEIEITFSPDAGLLFE